MVGCGGRSKLSLRTYGTPCSGSKRERSRVERADREARRDGSGVRERKSEEVAEARAWSDS